MKIIPTKALRMVGADASSRNLGIPRFEMNRAVVGPTPTSPSAQALAPRQAFE